MTTFYYTAKERSGGEITGTLNALNRHAAAKELRSQQLLVLQISDQATQKINNQDKLALMEKLTANLGISKSDKMLFYKQLAMMLRSGMTITSAVTLLAEETHKVKFAAQLKSIVTDLQSGEAFSVAIAKHKKLFSPMAIKIIASAELSGEMDKSLIQIAESMAYWAEIKSKVLQSMMYPFVVLLSVIVVSVFMVFDIIPKFEKFLAKSGKQLPFLTSLIIDTADFLRAYTPAFLLAFIISSCTILYLWKKNQPSRHFMEGFILSIPVIGKVFLYSTLSQFASTVSLLLQSGLTVLDSVKVMTTLSSFSIYRELYANSEKQIILGQSLRNSLNNPLIPRTMINVIAVGEETGELSSVLEEIGQFYAERLKETMTLMTTLVEPMLLLFVGGLVGIVYIGLFQAVLALATGR